MSEELDKTGFNRLWGSGTRRGTSRREEDQDRQTAFSPPDDMPLFNQDRAYLAFELRDNATRLHIQPASLPSRFPAYSCLLDIVYGHINDSNFTLIYSFMLVEVTGRNLWPVVHALNFGRCERICEFHKKLYDLPADQKATVIESIMITAAALPSAEKKDDQKKSVVDFAAGVS